MESKSWTTTSTVQRQVSSRPLRRHTCPITYTVEVCGLDGRKKTSKRKSEESLERTGKRRRTSQSPSETCNQTSGPSSGGTADSFHTAYTSPRESEDEGSTEDIETTSTAVVSVSAEAETRTSRKRKSEETEGPRKRSRKSPDPSEDHSHGTATEAAVSDKPGTSSLAATTAAYPVNSRAAFKAKYQEEALLGEGGFGSVFAGFRKDDRLPVAIKHIPQDDVEHTLTFLDGKIRMVPLEVALMLKVKPATAEETSAAVSLLGWYDLVDELILVLERPVPCVELLDHLNSRDSPMQEDWTKVIARQLVDALIEFHSKGVFHRDIKLENILLETGSDVPRVRIIDFGCGTFSFPGRMYVEQQGTRLFTSPEWFREGCYTAEPASVWQLGIALFTLLHSFYPFGNSSEIVYDYPNVSDDLSIECRDFLFKCLEKSPLARPSLETLKRHPWLT